jgi:hypothetical protein
MKMILSIFAAASVLAAATSAQANFSADFFEKEQLYGENFSADFFTQQNLYGENIDRDSIRSGQTLHPSGFLGAEAE